LKLFYFAPGLRFDFRLMTIFKTNVTNYLFSEGRSMRRLLSVALFLFGLSSFAEGGELAVERPNDLSGFAQNAEVLDIFSVDFSDFVSPDARTRNLSSSSQRLKNDRIFGLIDLPGLVFYTCRIEKSYSETSVDKLLKLLFQFTIQVNAP
jgi:hypothetical protein